MRLYRALLRLLPLEFRERFETDMERVFRAQRREARDGGLRAQAAVWAETLTGLIAVAPREHLSILRQDLGLAWRMMVNRPAFALTAVGVLALTIGATTAVFSVVDAVLLRPLPYPSPAQLVIVSERERDGGNARVSPLLFVEWQAQAQSFTSLAAVNGDSLTLTGRGILSRVSALAVSPELFEVYGAPMALGRGLSPVSPHDRAPEEVVLTYAFWMRQFGGDPGILGRRVPFAERTLTVVGVTPRHFSLPERADVFTPLTFKPEMLQARFLGARYLQVFGRLAPSVTARGAAAELSAIAARVSASAGQTAQASHANVDSLHEQLVAGYRQTLWLLFGGVTLVLLVASANVSSLLLARMATRSEELALRAALGASSARLFRQVLTESVLLAIVAGGVGLAIAALSLAPLVAWVPPGVPRLDEMSLDWRVLGFGTAATLAAGVGLGIAPAARVSTRRLFAYLTSAGRQTSSRSTTRARNTLLALEAALTLVLLAGGLLMARGLTALRHVDLGFNPANLLTAFASLPDHRYPTADRKRAFVERITRELAGMPGVSAVGVDCNAPLSDALMWFGYRIEGHVPPAGDRMTAQYHSVSGRAFAAMQTRLLAGRAFTDDDQISGRPVAIINAWLARRYWPGVSPIGRRIEVASQNGFVSREIVGVAASLRHQSLTEPEGPEVYVPFASDPWGFLHFAVRVDALHATAPARLREAAARVDPTLPLDSVMWMEDRVASMLAPTRFQAWLLGSFALMALMLSLVSVHGVMSYAVSLRQSELGVRMALGASTASVSTLVVREALRPVLAGIALGVGAVLVLARAVPVDIAGLRPTDPAILAAAAGLLLIVTLTATWVPARCAARVDPLMALRAN